MSDLLKRLKFDIYERVNLDDKNEDIKVIEETELTPQIKMLLSKDEVKLVGNLLLKIKYIGDIPFQTNEFEHNIPVEITIPTSRVVDAWKIDADIENFNIDLLSGRAVNATGVMVVYEKESVKVDKVKLPKEICEYIEDLLIGSTKEEFLAGVLGSANSPKFEAIKTHFKYNFDSLLQTLVIGWEVEQTPEDKVREYYKKLNKDAIERDREKFSVNNQRNEMQGIINTLKLLDIKIDGINT